MNSGQKKGERSLQKGCIWRPVTAELSLWAVCPSSRPSADSSQVPATEPFGLPPPHNPLEGRKPALLHSFDSLSLLIHLCTYSLVNALFHACIHSITYACTNLLISDSLVKQKLASTPFKDFIYLFLDRGVGRKEERERNINVWLPVMCPTPGTSPGPQPRHGP